MTNRLATLLVEDNPRDADLMVLALQEGDYDPSVTRVDTPEAMAAALREQSWDVIISDYSMPHFDGLSALALARRERPEVPFLLVSGTVGEEVAIEAMKAGANDYLMKDNLARLVPAVRRELRESEHRRMRRQAEAALRESEQRFRAMFDQSAVGIAQSDLEGRWLLVNQRLRDLYGYPWEELQALTFSDITHPDDLAADLEQFGRLIAGEISSYSLDKRFIRKDGSIVWANITVSLVRDEQGKAQYTMAVVEDITQRKQAEEGLKHQALHDPLTGLPNRVLLQDRLEQVIRRARRQKKSASLLLLDLDRFKEINDTFGHRVGDILLQELGPRLETLLRESDTVARTGRGAGIAVARLGGDEFAILLPEADGFGAAIVAERIIRELDTPFVVEDESLDIGASIGIARYPEHGETPDLLLQHADVAMYEAKKNRTDYAVYEAAQDPYTRSRIALIGDLRRALAGSHRGQAPGSHRGLAPNGNAPQREELVLHYQPKLDVSTGAVLGAEALIRWEHPQEGFIPPPQIIELAEHTGLIKPLTRWVLTRAVSQCRSWLDAGLQLSIAVNLSARNLHDLELPGIVREILDLTGLPASSLVLEITETAVMIDPQRALTVIAELHTMGVGISIDDFGMGYSSLSYLQKLPADEVKIDKSFVMQMDRDEADRGIVRMAITLAHDLGLKAVAEGIESQETWDQLKQLECDAGQGYYFARPMPAGAFEKWLASR